MENFKSFGGKITVPLMEGYTAVTGPNGSGKSNITDAILFVLGPKSSKAVRAGKLTDLIFDGGKSKNRAPYMKVSLVFENEDRIMPWDADEVRLTRHVKVSDNGTDYSSYFYVNDRKSTMGEFDSLLTRARISADGYNLVQQGDVTRIVQMGNLERRRIIDGISGIASFDADIDKAKGERAEAEDNLEKIGIVVDELAVQIEKLDRDRQEARRYLDAQAALEVAKAQHAHRRLQIETARQRSVSEQVGRLESEIAEFGEAKARLEEARAAKEAEVRAKEQEIADSIGPEYTDLKQRIEDAKVDLATRRNAVETAEEDLAEQEEFRQTFEDSIAENNEQANMLRHTLEELRVSLADAESRKAEAEAEEAEVSRAISETGGEQGQLQERLDALDAAFESRSASLAEAQGAFSAAEAAAEEAHAGVASLDERIQGIDFEVKDARWSLEQLKAEAGPSAEDYGNRILEAKRREAALEKREAELAAAHRRLDSEYNALQAEKKVSERMNRGSAAVEAIMALRNRGEMKGIHGTVQELATVDKEYETALSVAAGGKMAAVVVDDDQVAADCINYLKREGLGRVTFLPLSKMMGGKPRAKAIMCEKETEGYAIDLIDFDPKYRNAFWYVLGDTLVVRDMDAARRIMGGVRIVTRAGELIEASGAMVGGTISQKTMLKFGAASEDKLSKAGEALRGAQEALEGVREELRAVRAEIKGIDDEMRSVSSSGMKLREQMAQTKGRVDELERSRRTASEEMRAARDKAAAADAELERARAAFAAETDALAAVTSERSAVKDRIAEIAPVELQNRIAAVRDRLYRLKDEINELRMQINGAETEIAGLGKQNESLQMQLDSVNEAIAKDRAAMEEGSAAIERAEIDLSALKRILSDMESGIEGLRGEKDALVAEMYGLDSDIRDKAKDIENKGAVLESSRAQLLITAEAVEQARAEVEALTVEVPEQVPSEQEILRNIRSLENTIARIGNVNLRAIEDYDERKARYDGLVEEVAAIEKHKAELTELVDALSAKKKGLFMKSYDAVDENFRAIYAQLSGGGEAYMRLEDEDDPFAGGLMINAKPRNGKLLRLEALSGGEKSLTALSFIFAIQEYQPSPFYVLDEVDMFLDSVNAEMVAKRVRESSAKAQFIQVSLRKVTLAMADHLIGVTRPPSGISKVIMQPDMAEVSKYEEAAAAEEAD